MLRFTACFLLTLSLFWGLSAPAFTETAVPTTYDSYLEAVNISGAWNLGFTGAGVTVGIVDDCFETDHPYFSDRVSSLSYNFGYRTSNKGETNSSNPYWDNYTLNFTKDSNPSTYSESGDQHGVSTTGCVGAYSTTDSVYGPAYGATLAGLRIDFNNQSYYDGSVQKSYFSDAIAYENSTIQIKSNSYSNAVGYSSLSNSTNEIHNQIAAITNATDDGTILVYSAGNERQKAYTNSHDANKKAMQAHPSTITVAATGNGANYNSYAYFSDYGANVFVTAPGVSVLSSDRTDGSIGTNYYKAAEYIAAFEGGGYTYVSTTHPEYTGYATGNRVEFSGTSASAPVVSGVLALAVEAVNRNNTLNGGNIAADTRLMKHLIVKTAQKIDLGATSDEAKWTTNGAGNSFSASYGFGQIDAAAMVQMASDSLLLGVTEQTVASATWYAFSKEETQPSNIVIDSTSTTPKLEYVQFNQGTFAANGVQNAASVNTNFLAVMTTGEENLVPSTTIIADRLSTSSTPIEPGSSASITATFGADAFGTTAIQPLEEVTITIAVSATNLGSLQLGLESPSGTESILAFADATGGETSGDLYWSFTSNAFWGENPLGDWIVTVTDALNNGAFTLYEVNSTFFMGDLSYTYIPEPSSWVLLVLGGSLIFALRRKKRGC